MFSTDKHRQWNQTWTGSRYEPIFATLSSKTAFYLLFLIDYDDQIGRMPFRSQGKAEMQTYCEILKRYATLAQLVERYLAKV